MNPVETESVDTTAAEGDFASGLRTNVARTVHPGDFAVGLRTIPNPLVVEDFATGMRARPAFDLHPGDFATGQRSRRTIAARANVHRSLWHAPDPLAQPGRV